MPPAPTAKEAVGRKLTVGRARRVGGDAPRVEGRQPYRQDFPHVMRLENPDVRAAGALSLTEHSVPVARLASITSAVPRENTERVVPGTVRGGVCGAGSRRLPVRSSRKPLRCRRPSRVRISRVSGRYKRPRIRSHRSALRRTVIGRIRLWHRMLADSGGRAGFDEICQKVGIQNPVWRVHAISGAAGAGGAVHRTPDCEEPYASATKTAAGTTSIGIHPRPLCHDGGMSPPVIQRWIDIIENGRTDELDQLLAEDAVFYSPAVFTPQEPGQDCRLPPGCGKAVRRQRFPICRQWYDEHSAILEFTAAIDGVHVNGVDMIIWNDVGQIASFKVMLRPFKALQTVIPKMAELLQE